MKTQLGSMASHYLSDDLSTCDCWLVVCVDGDQYGFTDHPESLTIDGITYYGARGFERTATEATAQLSPDNHLLKGIISTDVTAEDIQGRKFHGAQVYHFSVNYNDPAGGKDRHGYGYIGDIKLRGKVWEAEFTSLSVLLEREIVETRSPYCRVALGSERCGVVLQPAVWSASATVAIGDQVLAPAYDGRRYVAASAGVTGASAPVFTASTTSDGSATWQAAEAYIKHFTVTSVINARHIFVASVVGSIAPRWFQFGQCVFSTGDNTGWAMDVKAHNSSMQIEVLFDYPFQIAVGDTGALTVGCNHKLKDKGDVSGSPYTGHCRARFNNAVHFQGDAEIPGIDGVLAGDSE